MNWRELKWASWTAVAKRSGDTAFGRTRHIELSNHLVRAKSGMALRFPPQSMTYPCLSMPIRGSIYFHPHQLATKLHSDWLVSSSLI